MPEPGFIRVDCPSCNSDDVWFKCNACEKSDYFTAGDGQVRCRCGATYDSGVCTCGTTVPFERLVPVSHAEGPLALADLEVAWGRVGLLVLGLIVVASTLFFLLVGT